MTESKQRRSSLHKPSKFNKDAAPFVPGKATSQTVSPQPNNGDDTEQESSGQEHEDDELDDQQDVQSQFPFPVVPADPMFPMILNVSNIPSSVTQDEFVDFLDSEFDLDPSMFNIMNYQGFSYYDPESEQESVFTTCSIHIFDNTMAHSILADLNGYLWDSTPLEATVVPMFYPFNYYYYPPMANSLSPSPLTPSTSPPVFNPKFPAPNGHMYKPGSSSPSLPLPALPHQMHHPFVPGYHKSFPQPHPVPHFTAMAPSPLTNRVVNNLNGGEHGRNSLSSTSRSSSVSSMSSMPSSNALSSASSKSNQSGIPQFLMNFVQKPQDSALSASAPSSAKEPNFVYIEDEDGNPIKVNPCRLFIGNIPFSSTWSNLKNFLVTKSAEFEPDNRIDILRVEIPMHANAVNSNQVFKFNGYQTKSLDEINESGESNENSEVLNSEPQGKDENQNSQPSLNHNTFPTKALSRGFAIVTTGNQESSDMIIKHFDGIDFEGRNLTVRYDKFPDFNNYVLQQLHPQALKDKNTLANLAFERNSFQQKFYYGNMMNFDHGHQPHHNFQNHNRSQSLSAGSNHPFPNQYYGYNNYGRSSSYSAHSPYGSVGHGTSGHGQYANYSHTTHSRSQSHSSPHPGKNGTQSPGFPVIQPNFVPQIHPSTRYINNLNSGKAKKKEEPEPESESSPDANLNEDEKARELVNSFKSLGISS